MFSIQSSLPDFTTCLQNKTPVVCNPRNGCWKKESSISSIIRRITGREDKYLLILGKTFCNVLNQVEKTPVVFGASSQPVNYQEVLKAAKVVKHQLKASQSPKVKCQLNQLAFRIAALKYRLESVNGGLDRSGLNIEHYEKLLTQAAQWKFNHPLFHEKMLTEREDAKIDEACCHPKFAKLLIRNTRLREEFFKWALRDNNDVSIFIQFPAMRDRLNSTFLAARAGRFAHPLLRIEKRIGNTEIKKIVTIPEFNGEYVQRVNVLDKVQEVQLHCDWKLTLKKVLEVFANKNNDPGHIEFFGTLGFANWHSREIGWWNPKTKAVQQFDFDQPEWWKELPVVEELSKDNVEKRFQVSLKEGEWLVCAKASRTNANLDVDKCHGYMEVIVPTENGNYNLFPIGKYASFFPNGVLDLIKFIGATCPAKLAYPDENIFYTFRQHASYPIIMTEKQGHALMDLIKKEFILSRTGDSFFQFGAENCAFWVQNTLEAVEGLNVPNLFQLPMLEAEPANPALIGMFKIVKSTPKRWRNQITDLVDIFFCGHRGLEISEDGKKVFKSLATSPMRRQNILYQPGYLHYQIENKMLKGVIHKGHGI